MVSATADAVLLKWQAAHGLQTKGWNIERRLEKEQAWHTIGFMQSTANTSSHAEYVFHDQQVAPGSYQYRLKQMDTDGNYYYSGIRSVKVGKLTAVQLTLFPNPVTSNSVVQYTIPESAKVNLVLYNSSGVVIGTMVEARQPAGLYQVPLEQCLRAKGSYIVKLTVNGETMTVTCTY